ncbi:MAG: YrdB family protein [Actinomycetota bacterium]|nr:YrdB family protein [Actinomycetota bacterium]
MIVFESLTLLIRFLLELCMLAALGYWGFKTGDGTVMKALLGVGAPLLVAVVWGLFIAPKATVEVATAVWIGLQVIVFGAAAVALAAVAPQQLAALFLLVVVLDGAAMAVLGN